MNAINHAINQQESEGTCLNYYAMKLAGLVKTVCTHLNDDDETDTSS